MAEPITRNHQIEEEDEQEDEDEANEYNSECNSEDKSHPNQDYLDCSSGENESDAEEDCLDQNTVTCDQLCADHDYSELQQIEQSWHNSVSDVVLEMLIRHTR